MGQALGELVKRWIASGGIDARLAPLPGVVDAGFQQEPNPCRAGALPRAIEAWEERHGYRLPGGLRAWLLLSDGLYRQVPLIHPISAIGPMIAFARVPEMIVQPESWFEIGNPNQQTICIDLAYRLPGGGCPIFTSGDDEARSTPRIIARSFDEWFLQLMREGGREYWFDSASADHGDPWQLHRSHVAQPALPGWLRAFADRVAALFAAGGDELEIAMELGLRRGDVELIFRHLQHLGRGPASEHSVEIGGQSPLLQGKARRADSL
ncbi:MAG TPA: SMI1/KNR4 family protein [Isosphaeraceae bacterium]|nr:SMI1/KNR4 family protein [Isosphaeraceae bacterium]